MIYINDEHDEQKAQLEETHNSAVEEINRRIESGETEMFLDIIKEHFRLT